MGLTTIERETLINRLKYNSDQISIKLDIIDKLSKTENTSDLLSKLEIDYIFLRREQYFIETALFNNELNLD